MKADRKRLKGEKTDLVSQMQQLYATLESREEQLRDFIRNYEQHRKVRGPSPSPPLSSPLLPSADTSSPPHRPARGGLWNPRAQTLCSRHLVLPGEAIDMSVQGWALRWNMAGQGGSVGDSGDSG